MKGLVLAIPVTAMTITSYTSGLALQQRDEWLKPAVAAGLVAVGAGLAALGLTTGLRALLAWASFMGIGVGVMLPALNTLITGATDAQERGLITALYGTVRFFGVARSEEHTSELQSRENLVCRLLLEKKKNKFSILIFQPYVCLLISLS